MILNGPKIDVPIVEKDVACFFFFHFFPFVIESYVFISVFFPLSLHHHLLQTNKLCVGKFGRDHMF